MHFVHYYLDCLSRASDLVGDEGTGRAHALLGGYEAWKLHQAGREKESKA